MYYLAVCDTNVSPGIYQVHQIVETLDRATTTTRGKMFSTFLRETE